MRKNKERISFLILLVLLISYTTQIYAETEKGSIMIEFSLEHHTKPIAGAEFGVVKILDENNGRYSWNPRLGHLDINLKEIEDGNEETARQLAEGIPDISMKMITGEDGHAFFSDLESGVWLVYQTRQTGKATEYYKAVPCLVLISAWEEGNQVNIFPKTSRIEESAPAENPMQEENAEKENHKEKKEEFSAAERVQTGDPVQFSLWISVFLLSGAMILCVIARRRSKKNE